MPYIPNGNISIGQLEPSSHPRMSGEDLSPFVLGGFAVDGEDVR